MPIDPRKIKPRTPDAAVIAALSLLTPTDLLARANAVRAKVGAAPLARRGAYYSTDGIGRSSFTRAELVEHVEEYEATLDDSLAARAAHDLHRRFDAYSVGVKGTLYFADSRDWHNHLEMLKPLARVPRAVRMQALAFVGLTDDDLQPESFEQLDAEIDARAAALAAFVNGQRGDPEAVIERFEERFWDGIDREESMEAIR